MGSRPCSSAIRSEGLQLWKAPEIEVQIEVQIGIEIENEINSHLFIYLFVFHLTRGHKEHMVGLDVAVLGGDLGAFQ